MKKIFFAATAALAILCSCSKENDDLTASATGSVVNVSFIEEQSNTRAFFGASSAAESWEKEISSVTMFVFRPSGEFIVQRFFSPTEVAAKSARFALPGVSAGDNCEFVVVANATVTGVNSKADLIAQIESDASSYNGTFTEVNSSAKRSGGFVMSGSSATVVATEGSATNVAIDRKSTRLNPSHIQQARMPSSACKK